VPKRTVKRSTDARKTALQLIVLFGVVSLCGDIVYEGARSVNGPFLKTLGANAAMVGLIVGIGEFFGYGIRLLSGYFADRTKAYWLFVFTGYALLMSVPLLALAGVWQIAAILMVLERFGKALRNPAKDTILSSAAKKVGTGWGFGLNEAMDQIGAVIGPLLFTVVLALNGNYKLGYSLLWIPFVLVLASVFFAYKRVPVPEKLERTAEPKKGAKDKKLPRVFWYYSLFSFFTVTGFVSFALLGYHFKNLGVLTDSQIPLLYAVGMGVDAIAALVFGRLYDRFGMKTLAAIPILTMPIPFLCFLHGSGVPVSMVFWAAVAGIVLWGIVMGIQETIMKAAVADLTQIQRRATGYGIFNTAYGLAWLAGGALMGYLYDRNIGWVIAFAVAAEVLSLPLLYLVVKNTRSLKSS
jgi:MFS family permease